jgi:hypothetical protein
MRHRRLQPYYEARKNVLNENSFNEDLTNLNDKYLFLLNVIFKTILLQTSGLGSEPHHFKTPVPPK